MRNPGRFSHRPGPGGYARRVRHFALSAIGRDRPGIVAAVTGALLGHGVNIEDSHMTILRGRFSLVLVLAAGDDVDEEALRSDLRAAGRDVGLEALSLDPVSELQRGGEARPGAIVSVYGVDHPGIVHAVAAAAAERGIDITDLTARLVGDAEGAGLYAVAMEIALPQGVPLDEVEEAFAAVGRDQGVDVSVRAIEEDVL
jgi:glycine cleavage system transcriptional repressor